MRDMGYKVAAIRHPMPYGDLARQRVQRFADAQDLDHHDVTIEERDFLLKEIGEAPDSFRKTLRAKIVERAGLLHAAVGERSLPAPIALLAPDVSIAPASKICGIKAIGTSEVA